MRILLQVEWVLSRWQVMISASHGRREGYMMPVLGWFPEKQVKERRRR